MKTKYFLFVLSFFAALLTSPTKVQAEESEYEEVTYEDLVNRLHNKSKILTKSSTDPFEDIQIHAGIGLVTSASMINYSGENVTKYNNGIQLSFGIDLFSPNWAAEGAFRNFGQTYSGSEVKSLREFDLKVMFRHKMDDKVGFRIGSGIGTRYFKLSDEVNGLNISESTPTMVMFGGLDAYVSNAVSIGFEVGARSAMVTRSVDKNAMDITLRFDSYF